MTTLLSPTEPRPPYLRTISSNSVASHRSTTSLTKSLSFSHQKDKPRLYLALFPRGSLGSDSIYSSHATCDSYHWAFVVGSKSALRTEAGTAFHIVHAADGSEAGSYYFEETDLCQNLHQSRALLVRVTLAKVVDVDRAEALLRSSVLLNKQTKVMPRSSPGYGRKDSLAEHTYSCLDWVRETYQLLTGDSQRCLKSYFGPGDWEIIEERTRRYVKKKRQQGRFQPGAPMNQAVWSVEEIPTWNFWENRETVS